MSQNKFFLNILSPAKKIFSGEVLSLVAPGEIGSLGVLANHAPLITTLVKGPIIFRKENEETIKLQLKKEGFLEVVNNKATLLVDSLEEDVPNPTSKS